MTKEHIHAVLTGDLIQSRAADKATVDATMDILAATARDIATRWASPVHFTRFRGDGWQFALTDPRNALDATLLCLADLRAGDLGMDTRIAIGLGSITHTGSNTLADATGTAFIASGDALDEMSRKRRLTIAGDGVTPWHHATLALVDYLTLGWTAAQAEAAALWVRHPGTTQDDLAKHLNITRQAAQARLAAAGTNYLVDPRKAFQTHAYPKLGDVPHD